MSDWTWEYNPDMAFVVGGLAPAVVTEVESIAAEVAVLESLNFPDGQSYQGPGIPMREVVRPHLIVSYTVYPRDELVCIVRVYHAG